MALNDTALNALANDLKALAPYLSLHSANPAGTGANETTAGRQAANWSEASDAVTASNIAFTGGAASGPCTYVGLWSAATAGTFYGSYPLTGDQTFNASGQYTVTSLQITASST